MYVDGDAYALTIMQVDLGNLQTVGRYLLMAVMRHIGTMYHRYPMRFLKKLHKVADCRVILKSIRNSK